ncbi:hypothetical protein [Prosthecobacter sp.]|uniref:hypothetical protein n=1 Tax=Prosthecobacter sp. TaxID=1965333 RepID=UPI0037831CAF
MKETEHSTNILREKLRANLLGEVYDLEGLADWCQRAYPKIASCCEFRKELLDAINYPGLVSPKAYENWTDDDSYPTQELLQAHFREIWNACFPDEAMD